MFTDGLSSFDGLKYNILSSFRSSDENVFYTDKIPYLIISRFVESEDIRYNMEGFLFPETYMIKKDATEEEIDKQMAEYNELYIMDTDNIDAVRYQAKEEVGIKKFLEKGNFQKDLSLVLLTDHSVHLTVTQLLYCHLV